MSNTEIKARLEILRKLRDGEIKLEPCPFCGAPTVAHATKGEVLHLYFSCADEHCLGRQVHGVSDADWQKCIDDWNRRAK